MDQWHPHWVERATDQDEVVLLGRVQEPCPSKLSVKTTVCGDGGRCDTESYSSVTWHLHSDDVDILC